MFILGLIVLLYLCFFLSAKLQGSTSSITECLVVSLLMTVATVVFVICAVCVVIVINQLGGN